jgi:hypothetical protein
VTAILEDPAHPRRLGPGLDLDLRGLPRPDDRVERGAASDARTGALFGRPARDTMISSRRFARSSRSPRSATKRSPRRVRSTS